MYQHAPTAGQSIRYERTSSRKILYDILLIDIVDIYQMMLKLPD